MFTYHEWRGMDKVIKPTERELNNQDDIQFLITRVHRLTDKIDEIVEYLNTHV